MRLVCQRIITAALTLGVASAAAAPQVKVAPKVTKIPPIVVLKPDFAVSAIEPIEAGGKVVKVKVTVVNLCKATPGGAPKVDVIVGTAAQLSYNALAFVNGGASDATTLDLTSGFSTQAPSGATISVAVNGDKAVPEAWSGNNRLQINPNVAPFPPGKDYCLPANYE